MKTLNKITYVKGDATNPIGEGNKIIAHIVNNKRRWGAGFVLALSKKWKEPETLYRLKKSYVLGEIDYIPVDVENKIIVANMIAQHGTGKDKNNDIPLRYSALVQCLINLNDMADYLQASIHMPKIGSGLSGGDWKVIEQIIRECTSVPVTVYEF
jgi:O-acetyl-ADP-ribose deacetylase (regulator of RNase III)